MPDTLGRGLRKHLKPIEREQIRREVEEYFREHKARIRSFISYPVESPIGNQVLAVVNVQCVKRALMGVSAGNERRFSMAIAPLLRALAYFVQRLHGREIYPGMQPNSTGSV